MRKANFNQMSSKVKKVNINDVPSKPINDGAKMVRSQCYN